MLRLPGDLLLGANLSPQSRIDHKRAGGKIQNQGITGSRGDDELVQRIGHWNQLDRFSAADSVSVAVADRLGKQLAILGRDLYGDKSAKPRSTGIFSR